MPTSLVNSREPYIHAALEHFAIELPSWGFAQTGTRFGKYLDPTAASTLAEKLADAGKVHELTGCCPSVAVHVLWDFAEDLSDADKAVDLAAQYGVRLGSINPNLFQDQRYRFGSIANEDPGIRRVATQHLLDSIDLAKRVGSRDVSIWLADGSNYPGSASIRRRRGYVVDALSEAHEALGPDQRLLIEYKPFEPAFYHTDLGDWGMALVTAQEAGPRAHVLVDTGHHYQAQNIEQIVAWLLDLGRLGGFHFNDRRYADDDLTFGSIDPYQAFRIFLEIHLYAEESGKQPDVAFMVDQSHNLKTKLEAMVQTVTTAQMLFAKAALVDP
ncbi:MAG TPA: TIM barrel protein, partial [Rhodothermales bacterium]